MERKKFLIITSASIAGILIPFGSCNSENSKLENTLIKPDSLFKLMTEDDINKLGIEYLKLFPKEGFKGTLEKLIYDHSIENISSQKLIKKIKDKIISDFESNNIITLNGWILSKTEARQCALYSKK